MALLLACFACMPSGQAQSWTSFGPRAVFRSCSKVLHLMRELMRVCGWSMNGVRCSLAHGPVLR